MMRRFSLLRLSLLLFALLLSAFAHATSTANIGTISCSSSQSFDLTNGATLSCDGDFSLIGGSIDSDTGITISALGSLFLDNLTISAPFVLLNVLSGELTIANGVSITSAGSININTGNTTSPRITLAPGATLSYPGGTGRTAGTGGNITLSAGGNIDLNNGSTLTLVSSVPEPSMFWSLLSGGLLFAIRQTRLKRLA
jgi:hypothetical protein